MRRGASQATGRLQGLFAITDAAVTAAERLLPSYRDANGDHEGLLFLVGFEMQGLTVFTGVIAPVADHGPQHVSCSKRHMLAAVRVARGAGLAVLAQVHSHPGACTVHSEGDNHMVFMPFEGMLSIVVPWYGHFGLRPLGNLGVHQFQSGKWVRCERESINAGLRTLPTELDLR